VAGDVARVAGEGASRRAVAARGPDGDGQVALVADQAAPVAGVGGAGGRGRGGVGGRGRRGAGRGAGEDAAPVAGEGTAPAGGRGQAAGGGRGRLAGATKGRGSDERERGEWAAGAYSLARSKPRRPMEEPTGVI
jgi:hypothetical protein